MEKMDRIIQQRILMHRVKADLTSILEYYVVDQQDFLVMQERITEFLQWLTDDSPIA